MICTAFAYTRSQIHKVRNLALPACGSMHPTAASIDKIRNKILDIRNAATVAGLAGLANVANLYLANTNPQHSSLEVLSLAADLERELRRAETEWAAALRADGCMSRLRTAASPSLMRGLHPSSPSAADQPFCRPPSRITPSITSHAPSSREATRPESTLRESAQIPRAQ